MYFHELVCGDSRGLGETEVMREVTSLRVKHNKKEEINYSYAEHTEASKHGKNYLRRDRISEGDAEMTESEVGVDSKYLKMSDEGLK